MDERFAQHLEITDHITELKKSILKVANSLKLTNMRVDTQGEELSKVLGTQPSDAQPSQKKLTKREDEIIAILQ